MLLKYFLSCFGFGGGRKERGSVVENVRGASMLVDVYITRFFSYRSSECTMGRI